MVNGVELNRGNSRSNAAALAELGTTTTNSSCWLASSATAMAVAVPGQGPNAERDPGFSGQGVEATSVENMQYP